MVAKGWKGIDKDLRSIFVAKRRPGFERVHWSRLYVWDLENLINVYDPDNPNVYHPADYPAVVHLLSKYGRLYDWLRKGGKGYTLT